VQTATCSLMQLPVATDDQPATDHIKAQSQLTH
jgi:hypothetical protein